MKIALQTDPLALRFASESLKDEYDLVLVAVRKKPLAVEFASERIKQEETDFVDQAILQIASAGLSAGFDMPLPAVHNFGLDPKQRLLIQNGSLRRSTHQ